MRARGPGLLLAVLLLAACGSKAPASCPVRCGSACLAASACSPTLECPPEAPCDPCSGQCRARCTPETGCKDPAKSCCASAGASVCADLQQDPGNCGLCGQACGDTSDACLAGECVCGALGHACGAGELCCAGACVKADAANCGRCGLACGPGEACDAAARACRCGERVSSTAAACAVGEACCADACIGVKADPKNCGACGAQCANGQACADGRCDCSKAGCADAAQTCCAGLCAQLQSDAKFCGACSVSCGAGEQCRAGLCACGSTQRAGAPACAPGSACCATGCADLQTDRRNCGACGVQCGTGETCQAGKCTCGGMQVAGGAACTGSTRCCGGGCVNTLTNLSHCGGCGLACDPSSTTACMGGLCACRPGYDSPSGTRCSDIDECRSNPCPNNPNEVCTNTPGSYQCSCTPSGCGPGDCGVASDGCGGTRSCGGCAMPETCGGGGTPNRCGCTENGSFSANDCPTATPSSWQCPCAHAAVQNQYCVDSMGGYNEVRLSYSCVAQSTCSRVTKCGVRQDYTCTGASACTWTCYDTGTLVCPNRGYGTPSQGHCECD